MILHFHSHFSLRYGLISPEEIVQRCDAEAISLGFPLPILLADINNVSGIPNFLRACKNSQRLLPLAGVDVRNGDDCLYLLISCSNNGFAQMNQFLSEHLTNHKPFPQKPPHLEEVKVILHYLPGKEIPQTQTNQAIAIEPQFLSSWRLNKNLQQQHCIAWHTTTFRDDVDFETHQLLRCIDHNCLRSKLPPEATAKQYQRWTDVRHLLQKTTAHPLLTQQALAWTQGCSWQFEWGVQQNKRSFTGDADDDFRMMRELAWEGLHYRYPKYTYRETQRLEKEMQLIYELGFTAYFLINWDICRFAREQGYFYVGRGSGANSMVAFCLRITDVDPIDLDLYFERFINPHRTSPPDFDLDFSWQDRDNVTAYILNKYKAHGAALLATYNTFQTNAVVRELGKVFGLPKAEIDALLDKPSYYSAALFESFAPARSDVYSQPGIGHGIRQRRLGRSTQVAESAQEYKESMYAELLMHAHRIHNLPNHLSIHVGGILIPEKPIAHFSALHLPPKGFPIVQFSMLEAEDLGLAKFDILSQRGLGHIKDAVIYIQENQQITIDPHQIEQFKQDKRIERLIHTGHTTGCFYVESPAMRQLLRKLQCKDYLTLVAASSVIRPGVARSGMMRTFIERHMQPEKRKEAHPVLWQLMPETYGIMVYQEDVIKVAHHFAGLGLAESDVLRRGMSGKFRSRDEFLKVKEKFVVSAKEKGHPMDLIEEVWHQIESFAGYSFAKGHSASYAVESYQSLFLKAYYPLEFYTAVINNFGGFYRTEFYVHAARKSGAIIEAPCVNHSHLLTRIQQQTLWLGMGLVDSLETKMCERLIAERNANGPFLSLQDFKQRVEPGLEQMKLLIQIGAFRGFQLPRKALMWEAHALYSNKKAALPTPKLFKEETRTYQLPQLEDSWLEIAHDQINLLGFPLCSPFHLINNPIYKENNAPQFPFDHSYLSPVRNQHLRQLLGKRVIMEGYLVTVKPTRTIGGKEMNFGTWLDADGHYFDTIHFPPSVQAYPFRGRGVYRLWGMVTEDFGVFNVEISRQEKIPYQSDPRYE